MPTNQGKKALAQVAGLKIAFNTKKVFILISYDDEGKKLEGDPQKWIFGPKNAFSAPKRPLWQFLAKKRPVQWFNGQVPII